MMTSYYFKAYTWNDVITKTEAPVISNLAIFSEFFNIPLEHTPDPQPTVYEGILFIWGFRDSWGMLQGYVGVFLRNMFML